MGCIPKHPIYVLKSSYNLISHIYYHPKLNLFNQNFLAKNSFISS